MVVLEGSPKSQRAGYPLFMQSPGSLFTIQTRQLLINFV